ncbi:MAG: hypothetical protein ACM3MI_08545 [Clostridiales bacterium]
MTLITPILGSQPLPDYFKKEVTDFENLLKNQLSTIRIGDAVYNSFLKNNVPLKFYYFYDPEQIHKRGYKNAIWIKVITNQNNDLWLAYHFNQHGKRKVCLYSDLNYQSTDYHLTKVTYALPLKFDNWGAQLHKKRVEHKQPENILSEILDYLEHL